jgi:3'-phosphoadenosine 5'-phosphosulfate sulfotransferase (PAPS reductase)/FAD synthetase
MRVVSWFSCGAASAVATIEALKKYPDTIVAYCDTGSEHPDNRRFIIDFEKALGIKVLILKSKKYDDIWDVFKKTRYLVGVNGARCTAELKKVPRFDFQYADDLQVFGFDSSEDQRADRFVKNNPDVKCYFPLIESKISKKECINTLTAHGIEIPMMYRLGYKNNNCIGCVKGQAGYWNKVRADFPEIFNKMAETERSLNAAICKTYKGGKRQRIFLDELPPDMGRYKTENEIKCGLICGE